MKVFKCTNCEKEFTRKQNYIYHINNFKRPCESIKNKNNIKNNNIIIEYPIPSNEPLIPSNEPPITSNEFSKFLNINLKSNIKTDDKHINIHEIILNDINKLTNENLKNKVSNTTCIYCETSFTRADNLQRHMKDRCKSKIYYDELEKIKIKFESAINNNDYLLKEIEKLKKENNELKNTNNLQITTNNNNNTNNNTLNKNQINNGVINNNNLNVQLVQFGNENIDDLDIREALNVYLRSTGGNIVSNMLRFVNLNEKYPQNHNICMSDLSRELVKIFNGKKFIVKKFKDAKGDILGKAIVNTYKIVDKIENNDNLKKTVDMESKLKINKVSLKLINGVPAEDIVRDEIRQAEKLIKDDDILLIEDKSEDGDIEEREFNLEEQLRITHLEGKQTGLQEITLERIKEELYNGKCLVICD